MAWAKIEYEWKCRECGREWRSPQFVLKPYPGCGVGGDMVGMDYGRELREDGVMVPVEEVPTVAGVRVVDGRTERYRVVGGAEIVEVS